MIYSRGMFHRSLLIIILLSAVLLIALLVQQRAVSLVSDHYLKTGSHNLNAMHHNSTPDPTEESIPAQKVDTDSNKSYRLLYLPEPLFVKFGSLFTESFDGKNILYEQNRGGLIVQSFLDSTDHAVYFVVLDMPRGSYEIAKIPEGIHCRFEYSTIARDEAHYWHPEKTNLTVFAVKEAYYGSSSIWACPLPPQEYFQTIAKDSQLSPSAVTLSFPPECQISVGQPTFTFLPRSIPVVDDKRRAVVCTACLYNLSNKTKTAFMLHSYIHHYRNLQVQEILLFVQEGDEFSNLMDSLKVLRKTDQRSLQDVSVMLLPSAIHRNAFGNAPTYYLESVTTNLCHYYARVTSAEWVLMQFDLDEYVLSTNSSHNGQYVDLPNELNSRVSDEYDTVYIRQRYIALRKDGIAKAVAPIINGTEFLLNTQPEPTFSKSIHRPRRVNVAWVHMSTSPKNVTIFEEDFNSMILLHWRHRPEDTQNYTVYSIGKGRIGNPFPKNTSAFV